MGNNEKFIKAFIENLKNNKGIKLYNLDTYRKNKELGEELEVKSHRIKNVIEKCIEIKEKKVKYITDNNPIENKPRTSGYFKKMYELDLIVSMQNKKDSINTKEKIYYINKYVLEKCYFLTIKNKEFLLLKRNEIEELEFCYLNKEEKIDRINLDTDSSNIILGVLKLVENDKLEDTYSELASFFEF